MIRVQLPGRFRMYDETRCLNEEAIHSPMITKQQKPYRNTGTVNRSTLDG